MDAGVASEANIPWLNEHGYKWIRGMLCWLPRSRSTAMKRRNVNCEPLSL